MSRMALPSRPVHAEYPAYHFVSASGVAIFHVKTERVVLCYHSVDQYYFLPKGRRDAAESSTRAAEREGFEESGYRNRLLPLPIRHRQPDAAGAGSITNVVEPVWTSLLPQSSRTQYLLHWYIAETLPPDLECEIGAPSISRRYEQPPSWPGDLLLRDRIAAEPEGHEPVRYENTGVNDEEALYRSSLVPVGEAIKKLGSNSQADVVSMGWELIQARLSAENASTVATTTAAYRH